MLFRISRVYPALSISFFLSLFLPSQGIIEKTMAQAFRRFPIIPISLKYLRVWQKGTSFRVDRDLFRSLSRTLRLPWVLLCFLCSPPTYLTARAARLLVFLSHFAPTSAGILSRHKGSPPRNRTIQHSFLHLKRGTKTHIVHITNISQQPRPIDIELIVWIS